jgi:hypothetical protein
VCDVTRTTTAACDLFASSTPKPCKSSTTPRPTASKESTSLIKLATRRCQVQRLSMSPDVEWYPLHENDWDCKLNTETDKYLTNCVCTRSVWSVDRETDVRVSCDLRSQKESKGAGKMACMGGGVEGRAVRRREDVKVTACRSGIWPKMVWSAKTIPKG